MCDLESAIVLLQLLVANPLDFLLFLSGQLLPDGLVHLDHAQGFGVVEHLHVLEPLEGGGQNVPLGLGVGVVALGGLIHQPHRVSQEQCALAKSLGIHNSSYRLTGTGGVIEQGDGLKIAAHFLQSRQSLLLVFLQFQMGAIQGLAPLGGEVVLDLLEAGVLAQEYPQLVLHGLRLLLHLPHRPAVHVPAQVDHAVLLKQVVVKFVLGDQLGIVRGLVVDLNGHLPPTIFNQKVSKPAVLVDTREGVLRVEIPSFLSTEGIGE